jgi:hypothetical protein
MALRERNRPSEDDVDERDAHGADASEMRGVLGHEGAAGASLPALLHAASSGSHPLCLSSDRPWRCSLRSLRDQD